MSNSKIEWTDKVWNPVTGCTKVSQGCKNCYAERLAKGRLSHMAEYANGFGNIICHTDRLTKPAQWKKPCKIFVNSMSDLFHEDVPFEFIDAVFTVMSDIDQHTYQVLTKRPERMLTFFEWKKSIHGIPWQPKPNVWLGVSVENQETANERIPLLLQVPAAVRFLSCEPLLGKINLHNACKISKGEFTYLDFTQIHWVIVGGESGPHARPMHPEWVRTIRDLCDAARVPFFFKQWGEWMPNKMFYSLSEIQEDIDKDVPIPKGKIELINIKGAHDSKLLIDGMKEPVLRVIKVGKKKSGALLDGKEYKQFPKL